MTDKMEEIRKIVLFSYRIFGDSIMCSKTSVGGAECILIREMMEDEGLLVSGMNWSDKVWSLSPKGIAVLKEIIEGELGVGVWRVIPTQFGDRLELDTKGEK